MRAILSETSYRWPIKAVKPRDPMDSGLKHTPVSAVIFAGDRTENNAHFDIRSSTSFPVSKTVDKRLLANTSGVTSMNMWFVASRRRARAEGPVSKYVLLYLRLDTYKASQDEHPSVWRSPVRVNPEQQ